MELFLLNLSWMWFNAALAVIGMILGLAMLKVSNAIARVFIAGLWFLFIPNTIYMVTDLAHLSWQLPLLPLEWQVGVILQFVVLAVLGVVTFVIGVYPFEKLLSRSKQFKRRHVFLSVFSVFNLLVGFGIILGRVYRIHSWYVFTQTGRVVKSAFDLLSSVDLMVISVVMGMVGFAVYFLLKDSILSAVPKKLLSD